MHIFSIRSLLRVVFSLFLLGLWLFGLGLLLWLPLRWWPGDALFPVQIANYVMPWLLVGLVPGLLLAIAARRVKLALVLAVPTIVICVNYAPLFLPRTNPALADNQRFKVMSYNVWRYNEHWDEMAALVEQENPDVVLLQEVAPSMAQYIQTEWAKQLPAGQPYLETDRSSQQAIISRYPLTRIDSSPREGRALKVMVDTPAGAVQVWNVHTTQPSWWRLHRREFINLAHGIAQVSDPLIVGGDFNTTDQSEMYRLINRQLHNAHWEAGWGFGFSFPADVHPLKHIHIPTPLIRIDHVFYNDSFFARDAHTLTNSGGSDHFPVVAEFSFAEQN